ncbi:MAG TPA: cell division protein ZipA C-terminal FtsZ-binding domain-containing protein [Azonexus sp.]|nr:cell division protein ZipA C-terminal FtsZ-binding domain-containing protein [Azonexus sp.]
MTELQMGLIGLGATAVVGVFGYNKWQEYRQRKLAEALLRPQHEDVLLGDGPKAAPAVRNEPEFRAESPVVAAERREPVFADEQPMSESGEPGLAERFPEEEAASVPAEPTFTMPSEAETEFPDLPAGLVPGSLLDPRLEFIAAMELVDAVPGAQIVHAQHTALQHVGKPVHWVAFNERAREWERIAPDSEVPVRRLRVGLQLVDRTGPVSDADLATFTEAMHDLADQLLAVADMPSSQVLDQAAEIDRFCAAVDLEIGVNLVSRAALFSGTKIRALAEAAGMVLGDDGAFTRYDDDGRSQFTLQNFETTRFSRESMLNLSTHGLTFVLDVPRVAHGERVFQQMVELAKRFSETLQGTLVDDNRQPLNDVQLDHIRREFIGKPQATMASYGIPAGSAQALRLFS